MRNVLVDTSVWVDYFRGSRVAVRQLEELMDSHQVVICGMVKQEVLQGSRDRKSFSELRRQMSIWRCEAEQPEDFVEAAGIFAGLRWKGVTIPPSDGLIAALAMRCKMEVYALDSHFERIPHLDRYPSH